MVKWNSVIWILGSIQMNLEVFIKRGLVKRSSQDFSLVKSIISTSKLDIEFLNTLEISEVSARKIMTNYYDVLRSLLEAMAAIEGYKIYSHEAFTFFLKEKKEDILAEKFDRFRKIRNKINYYGKNISVNEVEENVKEIRKMIKEINKRLNKN